MSVDPIAYLPTVSAKSADAEESYEALETLWADAGIEPEGLHFEGGTAIATRFAGLAKGLRKALISLLEAPEPEQEAAFVMGETLGEGGMGIVRAAVQTDLDRSVAIKGLQPELGSPREAARLIREARVLGALEHPQILPVHALGQDPEGKPMLVMKRIDGQSWSEAIAEASPEERVRDAYLRRHLEILRQVAEAVGFAHERGVIHRDIKPDNVLLGGHGDVYLADWGIALALRPDGAVRDLPLVQEVRALEGTPGYLAPEMAAGDGRAIDERSDVFLLGATLHHVLTGAPPHQGESLRAVLTAAFLAEPQAYDGVPEELAEISRRAMSRDKRDRYPTAGAFVEALSGFLSHRSSALLSDAAGRSLAELSEMTAAAARGEPCDETRLHSSFSECRFGFRQALRQWEQNEAARRGLRRSIEVMIEHELRRGAAEAAQGLLREIEVPEPSLRERVERAVAQEQAERRRLKALDRDVDPLFGARVRKLATFFSASIWSPGCLLLGWLERSGRYRPSHLSVALLCLAVFLSLNVTSYLTRDLAEHNATNRRMLTTSKVIFASATALWLLAGLLDLSVPHAVAIHLFSSTAIWSTAALNIDRGLWPTPFGTGLGLLGTLIWPALHFEWLGVPGTIALSVAVLLYRRRGQAAAPGTRAGEGAQSDPP